MKRNQDRFPNDFAFQLTREEWDDLLCQTGISSSYGGRRTPPFVFPSIAWTRDLCDAGQSVLTRLARSASSEPAIWRVGVSLDTLQV